ncbi:hypothetical protein NMY22_g17558 [Coprinellus aureogranulatus]|nr:hypothetical protein NMY22_g17558 [Coprinellus aureogranulatus]
MGQGWANEEETNFLQSYMPKYELCQVKRNYQHFWPSLFSAYQTQFPLINKLWPTESKTLESLSTEENEYYNKKLKAKQESLKEWFRWRANPRSRTTTNAVTKKDLKSIYHSTRTRGHKSYEVFARLYRDVVDPVVEEACRVQAASGKAKLPIWHRVAARLWRNASQEQIDAVNTQIVKEDLGEEDDDPKSNGEPSPETYQHYLKLLPGVLTATVDPAVRKAGVMAICTFIGPVPEAGGQIIATTLQFGDSEGTPLFSSVWPGHEETYVEHLGRFAQKYEFPEELCVRRSLCVKEEESLSEGFGDLEGTERTASSSKQLGFQPAPSQTGSSVPMKSAVESHSSAPGNPSILSNSAPSSAVQPGSLGQDAHPVKPHPVPMSTPPHPNASDSTFSPPIQLGTMPMPSHSIPQSSTLPHPLPTSTTPVPNTFTPSQPNPRLVPVPVDASQALPTNQVAPPVVPPNQFSPPAFPTYQVSPPVYQTNQVAPQVFPTNQVAPQVPQTVQLVPSVLQTNQDVPTALQPDPLPEVSASVKAMLSPATNPLATPSLGLPTPDQSFLGTSTTSQSGPHPGSAGLPLSGVQGSSSALSSYNQVHPAPSTFQTSQTYSQQSYNSATLSQSPQTALQTGPVNLFHQQQPSGPLAPPSNPMYGPYSITQDSYSSSGLYLDTPEEDEVTTALESWENSGKTWEDILADPSLDNVDLSSFNSAGTGNWCDITAFNSIASQSGGSHYYSTSDFDRPTQTLPDPSSHTNTSPGNAALLQPTTGGDGQTAGTALSAQSSPQTTPIAHPPPDGPSPSQTTNATSNDSAKTLPTPFMLSMGSGFDRVADPRRTHRRTRKIFRLPKPEPPSTTAPPIPLPSSTASDPPVPPNPTSLPPNSAPPTVVPAQATDTQEWMVHQQEGTRRSARGPIKNTWLEKQNLIGTNAPLLSTSITASPAAEADEGPLPWYTDAINHLQVDDLGEMWKDAVGKWATLEALLGYGRVAKTPLPVASRPDEWSKWAAKSKNGVRPYDISPKIENPAEFGLTILKWWYNIQPPFRASDNGFPSATFTDPTYVGDPWSAIRKSGPNGFVVVMMLMLWWGRSLSSRSAFTPDSRPSWNFLLKDICLCLAEMAKPIPKVAAKRDHDTAMADSDVPDSDTPTNKRQKM